MKITLGFDHRPMTLESELNFRANIRCFSAPRPLLTHDVRKFSQNTCLPEEVQLHARRRVSRNHGYGSITGMYFVY